MPSLLASVTALFLVAAESLPFPTVDEPLPRPGMGWSTFNFFGAQQPERLRQSMVPSLSGWIALNRNSQALP